MQQTSQGWLNGWLGILIFSGSLPATKLAITGFAPLALTFARAAIAAVLALVLLAVLRQKRPERRDWPSLAVVAIGVVVGFPLLTALALEHITSARSTVFVGLLPLCTALFGVLRGGERPPLLFWLLAMCGAALVAGFALLQDGVADLHGDTLMVAAVLVCGLGYAEGAVLSRRLGGWQVISWALVLCLPLMLPLAIWLWPAATGQIPPAAWWGLAYVAVFSMLLGFVFWYKGLAQGGIARIGQLQLLQPFFSLIWASLLLGEQVGALMMVTMLGVAACVAGARKASRAR